MSFKGYRLDAVICENDHNIIYKGIREKDNRKVSINTLRSKHPSMDEIAELYHEYKILQKLPLPDVLQVYEIIEQGDQYALVNEDFEGIGLDQYLKECDLDLETFFDLAIKIAETLGNVHKHHVVHKNIKPQNFMINPKTKEVKLVGFNYSTQLAQEVQEIVNPKVIEGTLAYISPEQTGRMNMNIDYRSDFYSLGVTFYEMLAGLPPFTSQDPMELVHRHIARKPKRISTINSDIPEVVSDLIDKLLEKEPDNRYQRAESLIEDLRQCQEQWKANRSIKSFVLGKAELYDTLNISQKLYGREAELDTLLNHYSHMVQGNLSRVFVCGYSGIGKTMLVNELLKPLSTHRGFFIKGKYDQLTRNTPYTAITEAFNNFSVQLLGESEEKFDKIKTDILQAMEDVAQIIIEISPKMELIVGKQPPLEKLPIEESQNRLKTYFLKFLKAIATKEHPLVMFIDDLQWIDSGSLMLLQWILMEPELQHLMLIGAYRDNEVPHEHPLSRFIFKMGEEGCTVDQMKLRPLEKEHCTQFLADTLRLEKETVSPLSKVLYDKTRGNPFFLKQLLRTIYDKEILTFSYEQKKWSWDEKIITQMNVSGNVVEFMLNKIQELPQKTQELLQLAACVGSQFDIQTISTVIQQDLDVVGNALWPAVENGLLLSLNRSYRRVEKMKESKRADIQPTQIRYQFLHDRVQQAAHEQMPAEIRQRTHLTIARMLRGASREQEKRENVFAMVDHYNQALDLLTDENEIKDVIELNYIAACKAKEANAYSAALVYIEKSLQWCTPTWWEKQYDLMYKLGKEKLEALYLNGEFERFKEEYRKLVERAKPGLDKAGVHRILAIFYLNTGDLEVALEFADKVFKELGIQFPRKPTIKHFFLYLLKIQVKKRFRRYDDLVPQLKQVSDPKVIMALKMISSLFQLAYYKDSVLFLVTAVVGVYLSLVYGVTSNSSVSFSVYSFALLSLTGSIKKAIPSYNASTFLYKQLPDKFAESYCKVVESYFLTRLYDYKEGYEYAIIGEGYARESGNIMIETGCKNIQALFAFVQGKPLTNALDVMLASKVFGRKVKDYSQNRGFALLHDTFAGLHGGEKLDHEGIAQIIQEALADPSPFIQSLVFQICGWAYYYHGELESAIEYYDQAFVSQYDQIVRYGLGTIEFKTNYAVCLSEHYPKVDAKKKRVYWKRIKQLYKEVRKAAREQAANFRHQELLIRAQMASIQGDIKSAGDAYDAAIQQATGQGCLQWIALAHELAALFYIKLGKERIGQLYLQDAYYYYQKWECALKVEELEQRYSDLTERKEVTQAPLDFTSLLKANQILASEIVLSGLIKKMLHIVIENAGADRAIFFERSEDQWIALAELSMQNGKESYQELDCALEDFDQYSQMVFKVVSTLKEDVIIGNVQTDELYKADPYLSTMQPKSVLCIPIMRQLDLVGIMYLENHLTAGAFTKKRVEVLKMFTSQIVISLENAHFFDRLEKLFKKAERFVPKQFLEILQKENIETVELGDSRQLKITSMFADIRNFTTLSESLGPEYTTMLLNKYLGFVAPIIRNHRGFVAHFLGDGILALFSEQAEDALDAAIEIHRIIPEFNRQVVDEGFAPIEIGIGLNFGPVMLSVLGEAERIDANVVSDAINVCKRIEDLNKYYGTNLLITETEYQQLSDPERYSIQLVDRVRVKGKEQGICLYAVYGFVHEETYQLHPDYVKNFDRAFKAYEKGEFKKAHALFESCLSYRPDDTVVLRLKQRCEELIKFGAPENWDGTYTFK